MRKGLPRRSRESQAGRSHRSEFRWSAAQAGAQEPSQAHRKHRRWAAWRRQGASRAACGEARRKPGGRDLGGGSRSSVEEEDFRKGLTDRLLDQKDKQNREEAGTLMLEWTATP